MPLGNSAQWVHEAIRLFPRRTDLWIGVRRLCGQCALWCDARRGAAQIETGEAYAVAAPRSSGVSLCHRMWGSNGAARAWQSVEVLIKATAAAVLAGLEDIVYWAP